MARSRDERGFGWIIELFQHGKALMSVGASTRHQISNVCVINLSRYSIRAVCARRSEWQMVILNGREDYLSELNERARKAAARWAMNEIIKHQNEILTRQLSDIFNGVLAGEITFSEFKEKVLNIEKV